MTFTLTDETGQQLSDHLSSFWFYMSFKLNPEGRVQLQQGGYTLPGGAAQPSGSCWLAVLMDGEALNRPPPATAGDGVAGSNQLEVHHSNHGAIKFKNFSYESSAKIIRNGEWADLRLFQGAKPLPPNNTDHPGWIDTSGWRRNPFQTRPDANHWTRSFSFGEISGAAADLTVIEGNKTGEPRAVSLARRMVRDTICAEILKVGSLNANGGAIPPLHVNTVSNSVGPSTLPPMTVLTNASNSSAQGYVMIGAGAFAAISADLMLSDWENLGSPQDVLKRLARAAWAPDNASIGSGRLLRKLHNIHDSQHSGSFYGAGMETDPVEVLHIRSNDGGDVA